MSISKDRADRLGSLHEAGPCAMNRPVRMLSLDGQPAG